MQIWPQEIRTKRVKNGAGFLSEACPVFQLRQITSNHIHIFVYPPPPRVLLHVTHWAEEGSHCQKIKADTSVICMDAVASTRSFNIFQPTSQGIGIFVSGENWSILEYTHLGSKLYRLKFWGKKKKWFCWRCSWHCNISPPNDCLKLLQYTSDQISHSCTRTTCQQRQKTKHFLILACKNMKESAELKFNLQKKS